MVKFFNATIYALKGLIRLFKEKAAHRELGVLFVSLLIFGSDPDLNTFTLVLISIFILALESINIAIEELCNFITTKHHASIGMIKDLSASAVLLSVVAWVAALLFYVWR